MSGFDGIGLSNAIMLVILVLLLIYGSTNIATLSDGPDYEDDL
ncbi:hypothetical protein [Alkalibacillus haloalkaliphilus]|nr:hypothetical protein [Alkalibacillus haloalkaliphilus]MDV2582451.1 hypothetical protein [Alkalibacillus haloalkaliphilus]